MSDPPRRNAGRLAHHAPPVQVGDTHVSPLFFNDSERYDAARSESPDSTGLSALLFVFLSSDPLVSIGQPPTAEEKYEPVSTSEFSVNMELSGRVEQDGDGRVNGGPIDKFSFWGHKVVLTNNMIKDGFIHTRDYGKVKIVMNPMSFTFGMELTPTQKRKLLELKNLK